MRILIAYRYFAPDTPPYASMLGEMSAWLAEAGHEVQIITAQPAYKPSANIPKQPWREQKRGVNIRRLYLLPEQGRRLLKALNGGLFILRAFLIVLFGRKQDVVWTATMPPVLQAWMLSAAARLRGAKFVYHMQDIHPEIAAVSDGALKKGKLFGVMQRLDIAALNRTDCAVVLSPDMADVLRARGAKPRAIKVIRNFALGNEAAETELAKKAPLSADEPLKFCFAGNIGAFQNLESLVEAFAKIDPADAELTLVGEGRAKAGLQQMVARDELSHVSFRDHMSEADVFAFLCQQDVGLVSLSPGLYKYAFPSKIWTYIAADLPMLAMVDDDSDLAHFLRSNTLGKAVDWEAGADALAATLSELIADVRAGNYRVVEKSELYHKDHARPQWVALIDALEGEAAIG